MIRKALLLEASSVPGEDYLPGALVDVQNWENYLTAPIGGAWYNYEITTLHTPDLDGVRGALRACASADFAFVAFSGHGEHVVGEALDETRLCLNDGDMISVRELNPGTARCTIVIDACRILRRIAKALTMAKAEFAERAAPLQRERCRKLFDTALSNAERGVTVLYSCDKNESAHEDPDAGGLFTKSIMSCGRNWGNTAAPNSVLSLREVFHCAEDRTTEEVPQQHPQYIPGRRRQHFPMAVLA